MDYDKVALALNNIEDTLPNKPSELLDVAVNDIEKVEKMSGYQINMNRWHTTENFQDNQTTCMVCFAGSVMTCSLNIPKDVEVNRTTFVAFGESLRKKFAALDEFRSGDFDNGLKQLGISLSEIFKEKYCPVLNNKEFKMVEVSTSSILKFFRFDEIGFERYYDEPAKFKAAMRKAAEKFRELGL